jgi:hypothetical protein
MFILCRIWLKSKTHKELSFLELGRHLFSASGGAHTGTLVWIVARKHPDFQLLAETPSVNLSSGSLMWTRLLQLVSALGQ